MGKRIHALAQQLLGKDTVEQCSLEEIREYTENYPFVAAAQFLLLEKLKDDEQAFHVQKQKAILYYHNPIGFQEFIHPEKFITELEEVSFPATEEKASSFVLPATSDDKEPEEILEPTSEVKDISDKNEPLVTQANVAEEEEQKTEPVEVEPLPLSISLESVAKEFHSETNPEKEKAAPAFEPFHTVDYFASQGIKLSQEDFSKDKFGKQLKSFTEWLKTMKRIPAIEAPPGETSENKVSHLAQDSIQQEDVYTEAMAEVWIKQGNKAKAIEVYNKLSLINPSKMTYFAAQIENLKRS